MKLQIRNLYLKHLPGFIIALCAIATIILYPTEFATGVKSGIKLLGESIIPALFPFMVLSSYIAESPATQLIFNLLHKPSKKLFNIPGIGLIAPLTGMLGGYPVGAQAVSRLFEANLISKNEAHRLICWSVNPGPTFVITLLGRFLIGNSSAGYIMYASNLLSSLTIGLFLRFLGNEAEAIHFEKRQTENKGGFFISAVASSCKAMISICGWVILFSAFSRGINSFIGDRTVSVLFRTVAEVTIGCTTAIQEGFSLPVICAITGFGGFAVIFQIMPYLEACGLKLKYFICCRLVNAALSAFYCSKLIELFPGAVSSSAYISSSYAPSLAHTPLASVFLLLTCILLIFEVDNKRKIC
jgi:sporulation integral membrane protein YlbJ